MRKLVYSQEAISNLKAIYDHSKKNFSKEKAESIVATLFHKISSLVEFPHLGKTSEIVPSVRELIVEGNTVYYQVTEQTIDIVFIKPRKSEQALSS